jgi:GntR family transcriptional repressor for pyruvate dehydrogenase complex
MGEMASRQIFRKSTLRTVNLVDQVYAEILQKISTGELTAGTQLPAESALADLFGVSRPVVREALSRLRADGVIISRHGSGSYVERRPSDALLSLAPIEGISDVMRCFEFRIALEGEAVALAAVRRTDQDLKAIHTALRALDKVVKSGTIGTEADIQFHAAIARASKNKLFESTMSTLASYIVQGVMVTRNLSLQVGQRRVEIVQAEHQLIYDALKQGDPDLARDAMRKHIENARARVLTEHTEP